MVLIGMLFYSIYEKIVIVLAHIKLFYQF